MESQNSAFNSLQYIVLDLKHAMDMNNKLNKLFPSIDNVKQWYWDDIGIEYVGRCNKYGPAQYKFEIVDARKFTYAKLKYNL